MQVKLDENQPQNLTYDEYFEMRKNKKYLCSTTRVLKQGTIDEVKLKSAIMKKKNLKEERLLANQEQCPNCGKVYTFSQQRGQGTVDEKEEHLSGICSDACWWQFLGPEPQSEWEYEVLSRQFEEENLYIASTRTKYGGK